MTATERRTITLAASVLVAAVLVLRVVPAAARTVSTRQDRLQRDELRLAAARHDIANARATTDSVAALKARLLEDAPALLDAREGPTAGAKLVEHVSEVATDCAVRVQRSEALPDSGAAGGLRRASARFALETDTEGMLGLLEALSDDDLAVSVRSLRVVAPDQIGRAHV